MFTLVDTCIMWKLVKDNLTKRSKSLWSTISFVWWTKSYINASQYFSPLHTVHAVCSACKGRHQVQSGVRTVCLTSLLRYMTPLESPTHCFRAEGCVALVWFPLVGVNGCFLLGEALFTICGSVFLQELLEVVQGHFAAHSYHALLWKGTLHALQ